MTLGYLFILRVKNGRTDLAFSLSSVGNNPKVAKRMENIKNPTSVKIRRQTPKYFQMKAKIAAFALKPFKDKNIFLKILLIYF